MGGDTNKDNANPMLPLMLMLLVLILEMIIKTPAISTTIIRTLKEFLSFAIKSLQIELVCTSTRTRTEYTLISTTIIRTLKEFLSFAIKSLQIELVCTSTRTRTEYTLTHITHQRN